MTTARASSPRLDPRAGGPWSRTTLAKIAPLVLAVVAEASWLTVLGNLIALLARDAPPSFPLVLAMAAVGALAVRTAMPRLGTAARRVLAIALVVAGTIVAALLSGVASVGPLHVAGIVGGIAVARGLRYVDQPLDEDALRHLLAAGTAVIVCATLAADLAAAMIGGDVSNDPVAGLWLGGTFAVGAILALAMTREQLAEEQASVGSDASPDWLRTAALVVLLAAVVGIPAADVLATIVELTVVALLLTWFVAGMLFGWTRRAVALVIGGPIVVVAIITVLSLLRGLFPNGGPLGSVLNAPTQQPPPSETQPISANLVAAIYIGMAGLVILVFVILAWRRIRGRPAARRVAGETRVIDHSGDDASAWSFGRWLRGLSPVRPAPRTAEEAYRALIRDVDGRAGVGRLAFETPLEHAQRLRREGAGSLSLDLLAADYAVIRFGGEAVTPLEDRRAVRRWRSLRGELRDRAEELRQRAAERAREGRGPDDEETAEEAESETQMPSRSLRT